jgi:chloride channel protein, CIC family
VTQLPLAMDPPSWRLDAPRRLHEWLRGSPAGLVALALAIGVGAGAGAVLFRYLILWFTLVFSGHPDYSAAAHAPHPLLPFLGPWFVLLAPVVGGLLYGPLVDRFAREARGHGVPEVMLAVAERGGRIRPQVAVVKALASALCMGCGGSVGREGPIVQVGSALGSALGQLVRVSEARLRLMVACGAAGGISATFNAPIAGVVFALELILRDFEAESFGVVVLASVAANVVGRAAFGPAAFLALPPFELTSLREYPLYAGLGLVAALVGVGFIRALYGLEDLVDGLWRAPEWLRPAVGGLVLGAVLLVLPEMYGVGYPVLERAIQGGYATGFLLLLLAGKIVATSLTIAIGGSGGVFAPSLFMGAMVGTAYGKGLALLAPTLAGPAGAYGLVGMGAVFAAAARAPLSAVLIIFELTGEYSIILPLMFAIVLAAGISNLLSRDTIYTLKLRRRGIDIMRGRAANLMELVTVAEAMQPIPEALADTLPLHAAIGRLTAAERDALPVVDGEGRYRGTVTVRQLEHALRGNALDVVVGDLAEAAPTLAAGQTLEEALGVLLRTSATGLPVVSAAGQAAIGWLTHRDVLRAYNERLHRTLARVAPDPDGPERPGPPPLLDSPLARLRGYRIVDLELDRDGFPAGRRVVEIRWPPASLLLAIRREGKTFEPGEDTELQRGDRLTVLVQARHAERVAEALAGREGRGR